MAHFTKQMKQEIMEMLRIEDLNFVLYLLFRQFKEEYAEELRSFFPGGKRTRAFGLNGMRLVQNRSDRQYSTTYDFEMESFFPGQSRVSHWGIKKFGPRTNMDLTLLLPHKLRNRMAEEPIDENKMVTLDFASEELGKNFQVTFTRVSEETMVGKIREIEAVEYTSEEEAGHDLVDVNTTGLRDRNYDNAYIELYLFMEKYPSLRSEILDRFHLYQKPRLQKEIEENQSS
jgi:hypothetical protein